MGWGGMAKGGVPDRWEDYSNMGTVVEGTQFIPFKVPLDDHLLIKVKEGVDKWGLEQLVEAVPQLGLVVDLTNTSR
jgi:atypical dual specificity phosphatase